MNDHARLIRNEKRMAAAYEAPPPEYWETPITAEALAVQASLILADRRRYSALIESASGDDRFLNCVHEALSSHQRLTARDCQRLGIDLYETLLESAELMASEDLT